MTAQVHKDFPNFFEVKHPIIQYKLSLLRNIKTNRKLFKELTEEIAHLLGYEATVNLPLTTRKIKTPLETFDAPFLKDKEFVIVPILRAGIGMSDGLIQLLPMASVGHIGLFRNEETFEPTSYYFKLPPNCEKAHFFVCDPMLATGGSACVAIDTLKERGVKDITFICLVAAPEGVARMLEKHPDVSIYGVSLDRKLDKMRYILPGLGDAGDRLWAVK
jgi:uracil phosphoribosyltransferase